MLQSMGLQGVGHHLVSDALVPGHCNTDWAEGWKNIKFVGGVLQLEKSKCYV